MRKVSFDVSIPLIRSIGQIVFDDCGALFSEDES